MQIFFSKAQLNENKFLILGHLAFFSLFVFSFLLAKERVIFSDSGAQIFEIIRSKGFEIYVQRFGMYLFQLLPVLAVKLHLPLWAVIYAYSLSLPVIAYCLWLITVYFLKNQQVGILMLFVMLGIRHTFFHAISETFQLMFLASFLYAWLFQTRDFQVSVFSKTVYYFVACLFVALCIFIHPVAIFLVIFILGLYILNKEISILPKVIIFFLSIGVIFLKILILTTTTGNHDTSFMISVPEFFSRISNIFTLNSTGWYIGKMGDFYWMPLLMFIISLLFYWKKKKYWHFAFFSCFVILFWVITVVIYASGDGAIGMERSFLPLFFLCGIPFVTEVIFTLSSKWDKVFYAGLVVLLFSGFSKIAVASTPYTQRLEKIREISAMANQLNKKKILIEAETAKQIFPIINWGLGLESILYSALQGKDLTVNIYIAESLDSMEEGYLDPEFHFGVPWWQLWYIDALNQHYFKLPKQLPSVLVLEDGQITIKDLSF